MFTTNRVSESVSELVNEVMGDKEETPILFSNNNAVKGIITLYNICTLGWNKQCSSIKDLKILFFKIEAALGILIAKWEVILEFQIFIYFYFFAGGEGAGLSFEHFFESSSLKEDRSLF